MKKLVALSALIFSLVAPAWGPTARAQSERLLDVCAVPVYIRVSNLPMVGGWGRAHPFSTEPGAFVGDIFAKDQRPRNGAANLSLSGSGYVLVDCQHPHIVQLRCRPDFRSCFELASTGHPLSRP